MSYIRFHQVLAWKPLLPHVRHPWPQSEYVEEALPRGMVNLVGDKSSCQVAMKTLDLCKFLVIWHVPLGPLTGRLRGMNGSCARRFLGGRRGQHSPYSRGSEQDLSNGKVDLGNSNLGAETRLTSETTAGTTGLLANLGIIGLSKSLKCPAWLLRGFEICANVKTNRHFHLKLDWIMCNLWHHLSAIMQLYTRKMILLDHILY